MIPAAQIFSIDSAGHHAFLTIRVTEGPKHWLKDIRFRKGDFADSDRETADDRPVLRKKYSAPDQTQSSASPRLAFSDEELRRLVPPSGWRHFTCRPNSGRSRRDQKPLWCLRLHQPCDYPDHRCKRRRTPRVDYDGTRRREAVSHRTGWNPKPRSGPRLGAPKGISIRYAFLKRRMGGGDQKSVAKLFTGTSLFA